LNVEDFYRWLQCQREGRYELVDGEPVMMAGAGRRHDRIVCNALRHLGNHLVGRRCQPFTSNTYLAIPGGNRRLADMGVDCGTPDEAAMEASAPVLVLAVLSPDDSAMDLLDRLEECETVPTLAYIVLVDEERPFIRVCRRVPDGDWTGGDLIGLSAVLDLPLLLDFRLPLSDLYAGLTFRAEGVE
jgi:Uma2 family endonuclease